MSRGIHRLMKFELFFIAMILVAWGCTESESKQSSSGYEELEVKVPAKIQQFDHIDSLYYSYLGISSFASDDGGFILPIWDPATLVKTNREGTEVLAKTVEGRGPGELLDIGVPTKGENEIFVYDQFQTKIVVLNRNDLSLNREILPDPYQGYRITKVYPAFEQRKLLLELSNSQLIIDEMDKNLFVRFDIETGEYEESIAITGKQYAPLGDLINERAGSAMMVPFSDNQFIVPVPERKTLLLYDTRTDLIAEINADFDTLSTITVDLPIENVSSAEIDSIKVIQDLSDEEWGYVEPYIPQVKAPADDMLYHNDKIWLKSNLKQAGDIWFILNMEGEIEEMIRLPKNSYLTHVSEHHLGVRLDEANFALYENPVGD